MFLLCVTLSFSLWWTFWIYPKHAAAKPTHPKPDPSSITVLDSKVLFSFANKISKYLANTIAASQTTQLTSPYSRWRNFKVTPADSISTSLKYTSLSITRRVGRKRSSPFRSVFNSKRTFSTRHPNLGNGNQNQRLSCCGPKSGRWGTARLFNDCLIF